MEEDAELRLPEEEEGLEDEGVEPDREEAAVEEEEQRRDRKEGQRRWRMGVRGSPASRASCHARETRSALWQSQTEERKAWIIGRRRWLSLLSSTALGSSTRFSAGGGGDEEGEKEEAVAGPLVALALALVAEDPRARGCVVLSFRRGSCLLAVRVWREGKGSG